jgi:uncharacterized protein
MSRNQLDQETSPYLLQHKDNPVHWRAWGPEALAEAQADNKPILLSIGYTACHWCHVMEHESFADPETAALMNELFVNIKVDREERPDVDQVYQTAANLMGHNGGWPLTMFLTPAGEPFFASAYIPNEARFGSPAFKTVMSDVARIYREQPDAVTNTATNVQASFTQLWGRDLRGPFDASMLDASAVRIGQRFDMFNGGVTGAPKFPSLGLVELLWRAYLRSGTAQFEQLVQTTLVSQCMGGLYDHVGGGFARYSTDDRWMVPHFEKMLYDNAAFISVLTLLWQHNRQPLYRERIEETIDWVLRDMMVEQGFASSIDADSDGEEGKYYLWSEAEIDAALAGTYAKLFKDVYFVTRDGNFRDGRNILLRLGLTSGYPLSEPDEALLRKQRALLLAARQQRTAPVRDDKVITDCNGMMIASLATAAAVFKNTTWMAAAVSAFEFVEKTLGDGNRLYRSWRNGVRKHTGFADDYAHMARAALALWETIQDPRYLERARAWVRVLDEHFWDAQNGGYFFTPDDGDTLVARARSVFDQSYPCANGVMVGVLSQLYFATADKSYRDRANALVDAFTAEINRAPISMGTFLNGLEILITGLQIVVVGPADNPKTRELLSAVMGRSLPNKTLILVDPRQSLPQGHPAFGKTMENGQPTAYICQRQVCSIPVTNPVTLSQALQFPTRVKQ